MTIKLTIQYNRKPYTFTVPLDATVAQFMDIISETLKVAPTEQTLIFRGEKFQRSDDLLSDHKIGNNAKLMLVVPDDPKSPPGKVDVANQYTQRRNGVIMSAEDLRNPPHCEIIARGPPQGAGKSFAAKLTVLPKEPFVVYDRAGGIAKLSIESEALWIQGPSGQCTRVFFTDVKNAGVQECPNSTNYFTLWVATAHEKHWFYFIPCQFAELISQIITTGR
jgi:uncharacterized ubiquitin-like protein YukD